MIAARLEPLATGSDWFLDIEISHQDTGSPIDFTGADGRVSVRRRGDETPIISGTKDSGAISFPDKGIIAIKFMADQLSSLRRGDYEVGLSLMRDGYTESVILGVLPVIDGIVSK